MRDYLLALIDANRDRIAADLDKCTPAARLQFFIKLLPYLTPRPTTHTTTASAMPMYNGQVAYLPADDLPPDGLILP